jgi:HAT1-interacting factor 1
VPARHFLSGPVHEKHLFSLESRIDGTANASKPEMSVDEAVEHARRAFALKQYEKSVEFYATALETMCVRVASV